MQLRSIAKSTRMDVRPLDVVVAGFVAAAGQQEAWATVDGFAQVRGPRPVVAAVYLTTAIALLGRRRAPLAVLATVCGLLAGLFAVWGSSDGLGGFLPVVLALYSVGRRCDARAFVLGMGMALAYLVVHELRDADFVLSGATVTYWAVLFGVGFIGFVLQRRAQELHFETRRADAAVMARKEADRAALAAQRAQIARELHDLVGHGVSVTVLQLVAAHGALDASDVETARGRLDLAENAARATLAEMRRLVRILDGDELAREPQPGLADIPDLVKEVQGAGVAIDYSSSELPETSPGLGLAAYRVVQEALTNVVKHARPPDGARVALGLSGGHLVIDVTDQGRGPFALSNGRGLHGMRERVALYGGSIEIGPQPEGGFGVHAAFPLGELSR